MEDDLEERIYTADSSIRKPGVLIRGIFSDIYKSRELSWRLFLRNFRGMYRQSLLGLLWAFVPPLMTALIWVFLNGQKIINIDDSGLPYPAFAITSVLLWSVFAQSIQSPLQSVIMGKSIIVKINFPRESLIISGVLQVAFDLAVKIILIAGVLVIYDVTPSSNLVLVPIGVISLVVMGTSLGIILIPVGMLYSDIYRALQTIIPFWMLLTPVIYPASPAGLPGVINSINPVSSVLVATRDWLFFGATDFAQPFLWFTVSSIILLFFGLIVFRLSMPIIIERIGA